MRLARNPRSSFFVQGSARCFWGSFSARHDCLLTRVSFCWQPMSSQYLCRQRHLHSTDLCQLISLTENALHRCVVIGGSCCLDWRECPRILEADDHNTVLSISSHGSCLPFGSYLLSITFCVGLICLFGSSATACREAEPAFDGT